MPDETLVVLPHPEHLIVIDDPDTVIQVEEKVDVIEITSQGIQGPPGPPGAPGASETFYFKHVQGVPASVWTISHGLTKEPNVTVVDSTKREVVGQIDYPDANTVVLSFSSGFSGEAYLS